MEKKLIVTHVETVAFDNQIVTMKSTDSTIKLHIHDQSEFDSFKEGDEVDLAIALETKKVTKPSAKKVAKKKAKKKVTKPVTIPVDILTVQP